MIDYSSLSEEEKIELFDLRSQDQPISKFTFKVEVRPGVVRYNTIEIGKKYKFVNPSRKSVHNRVVEIVNFAYKKRKKDETYENDVPLGVITRFLDRNVKGTYYDMLDLVEVN
jgi:hypothetical protein